MKPTFPESKITDARRYLVALVDTGDVTLDDYAEATCALDGIPFIDNVYPSKSKWVAAWFEIYGYGNA
jgi:hypothetical protein